MVDVIDVIIIAIFSIGTLLFIPLLFEWASKTIRSWYKDREITRKLAGRDRQKLLAESPYRYGHWQGEDGYRIYDKRENDSYLDFAYTKKNAEDAILMLIFADEMQDSL